MLLRSRAAGTTPHPPLTLDEHWTNVSERETIGWRAKQDTI